MRKPAGGSTVIEPVANQKILEDRFELLREVIAHRLGSVQFLAQIGRQLVRRWSGLDRSKVERRGGACVSFVREVVGLEDQRARIAWLELQRLVDRASGVRAVLETATRVGETDAG